MGLPLHGLHFRHEFLEGVPHTSHPDARRRALSSSRELVRGGISQMRVLPGVSFYGESEWLRVLINSWLTSSTYYFITVGPLCRARTCPELSCKQLAPPSRAPPLLDA